MCSKCIIKIGRLCLEVEEHLKSDQSHLLRGCIAQLFPDCELAHNHDIKTGKTHYRYPTIQYKIVHGVPLILAIGTEALEVFHQMSPHIREINLRKKKLPVSKSAIQESEDVWGISDFPKQYQFATPWLGLNVKNYQQYSKSNPQQQYELLQRCLIGNLLSASKAFSYTVAEKIYIEHQFYEETIFIKGQKRSGFRGIFNINFHIPDFVGIGKGCSHGYGTCVSLN